MRLLQVDHSPILINDRSINVPDLDKKEDKSENYDEGDYYYYDDEYYDYYDDSIFDESKNDSNGLTRTPRTPRSFNNPKTRAIGRKILSAEPSHLRMSNKEMNHMMMMLLHNAVTQVNVLKNLLQSNRN